MIPVNDFLSVVEAIAKENPSYRKGGSGKDGTCDCMGLIIGALQRCGEKWPGIHGTNWAARNEVSGFGAVHSNAELQIGELVFKHRKPGEKGYDLPDRYTKENDRNDYYHVGVVLNVFPLQIRHMTTPRAALDTKLGQWSHHGWCRYVGKHEAKDSQKESPMTEEDIGRLHGCLSAIEKQLDEIYEITGGRG